MLDSAGYTFVHSLLSELLSCRVALSHGSRKAGHVVPQRAHAYLPFMGH
jgi:hypothetical protein